MSAESFSSARFSFSACIFARWTWTCRGGGGAWVHITDPDLEGEATVPAQTHGSMGAHGTHAVKPMHSSASGIMNSAATPRCIRRGPHAWMALFRIACAQIAEPMKGKLPPLQKWTGPEDYRITTWSIHARVSWWVYGRTMVSPRWAVSLPVKSSQSRPYWLEPTIAAIRYFL